MKRWEKLAEQAGEKHYDDFRTLAATGACYLELGCDECPVGNECTIMNYMLDRDIREWLNEEATA